MKKGLDFHDAGLVKLNFLFEDKRIEILLELEANKKWVNLVFQNISKLSFDKLSSINTSMEVFRMDFTSIETEFGVTIVCLLGIGEPSWEMSFTFERMDMLPISS